MLSTWPAERLKARLFRVERRGCCSRCRSPGCLRSRPVESRLSQAFDIASVASIRFRQWQRLTSSVVARARHEISTARMPAVAEKHLAGYQRGDAPFMVAVTPTSPKMKCTERKFPRRSHRVEARAGTDQPRRPCSVGEVIGRRDADVDLRLRRPLPRRSRCAERHMRFLVGSDSPIGRNRGSLNAQDLVPAQRNTGTAGAGQQVWRQPDTGRGY